MIHKIRNYSVTLTGPDVVWGDGSLEVRYRPLVERVYQSEKDVADITRSLRLVLRKGLKPVVVVFEPDKKERYL